MVGSRTIQQSGFSPDTMIPFYQVDAFITDKPFSGNPAAVCLLDLEKPRVGQKSPSVPDERWMQNVAMEMNLSETAFLQKSSDGHNLRWFTPVVEVDLCGHATLASAHVLWESGNLKPDEQARFHTKSGLLTATKKGEWIELDFPATLEQQAAPPPDLIESLGVKPVYVGKNVFDYIIEVDSEETVRTVAPDFERLKKIPVRGVIVTSRSSNRDYDFVSRFFGPGSGVPEDPVTGSAHSCLGPFWKTRLKRSEFMAYQCSARGGLLRVRVGDGRVYMAGRALTVLRGELVPSD